MRKQAREALFQYIYAKQINPEDNEELKSALCKLNELDEDDVAYFNKLCALIGEHSEEFTKLIDERSIAFPVKRIFPADKSILFIALAEMLYCDDIPQKVSLNEAANIASKFSSANSASFILGILSSVAEDKDV